jgi:hypothetical protein
MCWNPVDDHPNPLAVKMVDEEFQIIRLPKARAWSKVGGNLITPRASKRMFRNRKKLHMSEAEVI